MTIQGDAIASVRYLSRSSVPSDDELRVRTHFEEAFKAEGVFFEIEVNLVAVLTDVSSCNLPLCEPDAGGPYRSLGEFVNKIPMSFKLRRVLQPLYDNLGEVVTYETLWAAAGVKSNPNAAAVLVGRLRKVVEANTRYRIESIRNVGYRMTYEPYL
jgi:hypothetical protein